MKNSSRLGFIRNLFSMMTCRSEGLWAGYILRAKVDGEQVGVQTPISDNAESDKFLQRLPVWQHISERHIVWRGKFLILVSLWFWITIATTNWADLVNTEDLWRFQSFLDLRAGGTYLQFLIFWITKNNMGSCMR